MGWIIIFLITLPTLGLADDWAAGILNTFGPSWVDKKKNSIKSGNIFSDPDSMNTLRLPMCFFFDETTNEETAEDKIRFLTKMYSACGIRLEPKAFTLKSGYSTDPAQLMGLVRKACPFSEAVGVRGSIQVETPFSSIPQAMCKDSGALGCSTLCEPNSVSVITANSGNAVAFHESLHANCCGSLCVEEGHGAGDTGKWGIEFSTKSSELFENRLCASLRKGASDLSISRWNAPLDGTTYRKGKRPGEQVDLNLRVSLLPKEVVPAAPVQVASPATEPSRAPASLPPYIFKPSGGTAPQRFPDGDPHKPGGAMRKEKESGKSITDMYELSE